MSEKLSELKIGFWNINGLNREKSTELDLHKEILKYDIVFLLETWHDNKTLSTFRFPSGFQKEHVFRGKKGKRGRKSGGIIVLFKENLDKQLFVLDKSLEDILWLKESGINQQNIYIAAVYNSPEKSTYNDHRKHSICTELRNKLLTFTSQDLVLIGGNFNARTGRMLDFIEENEKDIFRTHMRSIAHSL